VLRPLALALVLVAGAYFAAADDGATDASGLALEAASVGPVRLAALPPDVTGDGAHGFAAVRRDGTERPVRFDPCRPVRYAVRAEGALPGADALLESAVAEVSRATGLVFVREPDVTGPVPEVEALEDPRPDGTFPPALVAWSSPDERDELAGSTLALGGGTVWAPPGRWGEERLVGGLVTLDAPDLAQLLAGPDGPARVRGVLLHELAHLVGLAHVDDETQLLHPATSGTAFADGDLRGLRAAGEGPCFLDW
jgi:hypothetical protein